MKRKNNTTIFAIFLFSSMITAATAAENRLSLQTGSTGLPGGAIRPLCIDNYGLLWIGGSEREDAGFACYDETSLLNVTSLYGAIWRGYGVHDFSRDVAGNLWVQTRMGYPLMGACMRFDGEKVTDSWTLHVNPRKLANGPDSILYAGGLGGLAGFENEEWHQMSINNNKYRQKLTLLR